MSTAQKKKNFLIIISTLFGLVIWSFIAVAAGAQSAPSHSIQVNGQALMYVEPDVANLNLGIEIQADSAANAQEQLRYQASMVLDALSREGIQRSKMKTSSYRISPVYSTETGKENYIEGYKAETSISVEISDLESLAMIIDKAIAAGANVVRSVSYDRRDLEAFKAQLIKSACLEASSKAEVGASALGLRLGAPIRVSIQDRFSALDTGNMVMKATAFGSESISPGEIEISVTVSAEFELIVE